MRIEYYPKSEIVTFEAVEIYKYIIRKQKHYWILYLESEDRNWMVLEEPPTDENKILAIPVKKIEGTYEIWDEGEYWLDFQEDKKITFNIIKGDKLIKGVYVLIKLPDKNCLWFKRRLRDWEIEMQNENKEI